MTKKKTVKEYATHREETIPVRIFKSSKNRIDQYMRRLTIASGGVPLTPAQVIDYLLDLADATEKFLK